MKSYKQITVFDLFNARGVNLNFLTFSVGVN